MVDDGGPDAPDGRDRGSRPSERIRIVGAESASGDDPASEQPDEDADAPPERVDNDDPNRFGAIPVISPDDPPPPGVDDTDQAATEGVPTVGDGPAPPPEQADLPHWTDPPSGQVPKIDPDEDLDVWAGLSTGPQWKGQGDEGDDPDDFSDLAEERMVVPGQDPDPDADQAPATVAFDDLAGPAAQTTEAAGGPPQRPADPELRGGDPYPPPVEEPPTGGGGGDRDMTTAVLVGVGLVVAMFVCFFIGPAATVLLATGIITFAAAEFFSATRKAGYHPVPIIGLTGTAGLVLAAYWRGEAAIPLVMFLVLVTTMLWWLMDLSPDREVPNVGITVFGVFYIGGLGSFAALLLKFPDGIGMLFGAVLVTVAYDVGGLVIGQRFGNTRLGPASPNKTLEGLVGGAIAAVVVAVVVLGIVPGVFPWEVSDAFALGVGAAIAAPLGDLCESRLKRDLGLKDMGDILPGHGGVLDRFDALLFVLPVTFYVVRTLEVFANTPS